MKWKFSEMLNQIKRSWFAVLLILLMNQRMIPISDEKCVDEEARSKDDETENVNMVNTPWDCLDVSTAEAVFLD